MILKFTEDMDAVNSEFESRADEIKAKHKMALEEKDKAIESFQRVQMSLTL